MSSERGRWGGMSSGIPLTAVCVCSTTGGHSAAGDWQGLSSCRWETSLKENGMLSFSSALVQCRHSYHFTVCTIICSDGH